MTRSTRSICDWVQLQAGSDSVQLTAGAVSWTESEHEDLEDSPGGLDSVAGGFKYNKVQ